jgi:hypothetical protein
MRRAQQAFRVRQQAAHAARDERLLVLESSIAQMSSVFLSFADIVVTSERLRNDPSTLQKLCETMRSFATIAQQAENATDSEASIDEPSVPGALTVLSETSASRAPEELKFPGSSSQQSLMAVGWPHAARRYKTEPYLIRNPFGNGWADYVPRKYIESLRRCHPSSTDSTRLGVRILQYTMTFAHDTLTGSLPVEHGERAFKFALFYSSKEEILNSVRWFLGPGYEEIHRLGYFSPEEDGIARMLNDGLTSMRPLTADLTRFAQMSNECSPDEKKQNFLNAFGIEEYLEKKGARFVDADTLEVSSHVNTHTSRIQMPENGEDVDVIVTDQLLKNGRLDDTSDNPTLVGCDRTLEGLQVETDSIQQRQNESKSDSAGFRVRNAFSFNALLGELAGDESPGNALRSTSSLPGRMVEEQKHRISFSVLLDQLAFSSVCLENGPAFPRAALENAIALSVVA